MPSKPAESLDVNPLTNQQQADMLGSLADEEVVSCSMGISFAVDAVNLNPYAEARGGRN